MYTNTVGGKSGTSSLPASSNAPKSSGEDTSALGGAVDVVN